MEGVATRAPRKPSDFSGPLLVLAAFGLIVHVVHPASGTMFDNDNFGGTVVMGAVAIIAGVIGGFMTRSAMRRVALRAPCPSCGSVMDRQFENPMDPKSLPTPCSTCIAYLRATPRNEVNEETDANVQNLATKFPYGLSADQYTPAVKHTNRRLYKFEMPPMCAICGDTSAKHERDINDGDAFGDDVFDVLNAGHIPGRVGAAPSAPTEDDKYSRGLSALKAPVCDRHTESADPFGDVIQYSQGKLEFASYRYYKAFCELNHITRATARR